jgi:murein DD-endopeptidase MepM/ murein hydrolase activator NlpD
VVGWAIIASAIILMDSIGSGSFREQAKREKLIYEQRLNELSAARDQRAEEALMAQDRFNAALGQVSQMQSALLDSEDHRKELETGIDLVQSTLRGVIRDRDSARRDAATLSARLDGTGGTGDPKVKIANYETTLDFLAAALSDVAVERDMMADAATHAEAETQTMVHEARLLAEKNDRIFAQLEDAVSISLTPLDKMFKAAGMPTEQILETVRKGYSGQGGPMTPITLSTKGSEAIGEEARANAILDRLDRLNIYRIAAQKAPFGMPLKSSFRFTSGFGHRWGRLHEGTDLAGAYGSAIYATADGVVVWADWQSGYGRLVKIQHEFGIETRYGHMSEIRVKVGQRVSRGDRIGDMGNSGRSTGTHLHYEVRIGGKPVNPMTYIKAGTDVF